MSNAKFPKLLDYTALQQELNDDPTTEASTDLSTHLAEVDALYFADEPIPKATGLTGSRLRSYAFAVLTRREYSKAELIEKLALYAVDREEVLKLVDEFAAQNYQSDQRVAEIMLSSQKRRRQRTESH